jgi:thymidylate kinase
VLSDRYTPSTFAYQILGNSEIGRDAAEYLLRLPGVIGLPEPDVVFWLDIDAGAAEARLSSRGVVNGFDERGRKFFERVRGGYEKLGSGANWIKIDASLCEDDVFDELSSRISGMLGLG